jgi:transposase
LNVELNSKSVKLFAFFQKNLEKQMVTDHQVRRLFLEMNKQQSKSLAAAKSDMDEKTARKYVREGKLPSQLKKPRNYRTRKDPFDSVWEECYPLLEQNSGLEARQLFQHLQREYPGRFSDGQLRSFQRKVRTWRALEGPCKEVFFPQLHPPGELGASDFTHMKNLGVTIQGEFFPHLIFHFVLTYSNWETGNICYSESFESLSEGLQNAIWKLGGLPRRHRTDSLSAAVHKECNPEEFTRRYKALLSHYGLIGERTNPGKSHENGDVEKSHHLFKKALDQSLMLRGSRDFDSLNSYKEYIEKLFTQLNAGRHERFLEECKKLRKLPARRLEDFKEEIHRVSKNSTIMVNHNVYSVHSRLIDEKVKVRLYAQQLELWYGGKQVDHIPRLRGNGEHRINYRHIIDWLLRKPGAFANYRYRDDLFPTTRFRMAYDYLVAKISSPARVSKEYLQILNLAAKESEIRVDDALRVLFEKESEISYPSVLLFLKTNLVEPLFPSATEVRVSEVDLENYDQLLSARLGHPVHPGDQSAPGHCGHPDHISRWDEVVSPGLSEKAVAHARMNGYICRSRKQGKQEVHYE